MPKVSIIIPTYNRQSLIGQTVDCVLAQTYSDYEIIVVDDGSTDNTQAILAQYGEKIKYIYQHNQGPAAARNMGFKASKGTYLLFLDSDDLIAPNMLGLQVNFLEQHTNFGVVYSAWQYVNEDANQILGEVRPNKQGDILEPLLYQVFYLVTTGIALIRRECLEQVGQFDEVLPGGREDFDLWLRLALAGHKFGYVDQPLLKYRMHKNNISKNSLEQLGYKFVVLDKFFKNPDLPENIKNIKPKVYGFAYCKLATKYYLAGEIETGREYFYNAIAICPPLAKDKTQLLRQVISAVLSYQTDNPAKGLDNIYTDSQLPVQIKSLRSEAYVIVYLDTATKCYRAGENELGQQYLQQMVEVCETATVMRMDWLLDWIADLALAPQIDDPHEFVEWVFDNIPKTSRLHPFRRRAHGRWHVAAAFSAYQHQYWRAVRRYFWSALWLDPTAIRNQGFVSIGLRSLFV